jgi:hypothetical protein
VKPPRRSFLARAAAYTRSVATCSSCGQEHPEVARFCLRALEIEERLGATLLAERTRALVAEIA